MSSVYIPRAPWYAKGVLFILLLTTKMLRYIHTFINYYGYVNILRLVGYIARIYLQSIEHSTNNLYCSNIQFLLVNLANENHSL